MRSPASVWLKTSTRSEATTVPQPRLAPRPSRTTAGPTRSATVVTCNMQVSLPTGHMLRSVIDDALLSGLTNATSILGDRWSPAIIAALLDGPQRYRELKDRLGIAPNILSARLKALEQEGLIVSTPYSDRPVRLSYALTPPTPASSPTCCGSSPPGALTAPVRPMRSPTRAAARRSRCAGGARPAPTRRPRATTSRSGSERGRSGRRSTLPAPARTPACADPMPVGPRWPGSPTLPRLVWRRTGEAIERSRTVCSDTWDADSASASPSVSRAGTRRREGVIRERTGDELSDALWPERAPPAAAAVKGLRPSSSPTRSSRAGRAARGRRRSCRRAPCRGGR